MVILSDKIYLMFIYDIYLIYIMYTYMIYTHIWCHHYFIKKWDVNVDKENKTNF